MKRIRLVYVSAGYGRIDSDDPRLNFGVGLFAAAYYFGRIAARREFGSVGLVVDVEPGKYHRMTTRAKKQAPKRARFDITGFYDQHVIIGCPMGCGLYECTQVTIPIRITRARGDREYYEESATPRREPPLFRKR